MSDHDIQIKLGQRYVTMPNDAARDERISIEARGFLCLIMSMNEGWVFRRNHMMKLAGVGRDKYYRILTELKDADYLTTEQPRCEDGQFGAQTWIVDPSGSASTASGLPASCKSVSGKPAHLRNLIDKKPNNKKNIKKDDDFFSEEDQPSQEADKTGQGLEDAKQNEALFDEWWDNWPSHPRKAGKAACRALYLKSITGKNPNAAPITGEALNKATLAYIASVREQEFLKGTLAWLRVPGWEPFVGAEEPEKNRYQDIISRSKER